MKTKSFFIAAIQLSFSLTNLMAGPIDSLKIIPEIPTTNDTVKIISYTSFVTSYCSLDSSSVTLEKDTVNISAWHIVGPLLAVCNSIDTLTIGRLNFGNYELYYEILHSYSKRSYGIDTIAFTVQFPNNVRHIEKLSTKLKIYPNPATGNLTVSSVNFIIQNIALFDLTGNCLFQDCVIDNQNYTLNTSGFSPGVYLLKVETEKKKVVQKIVVNH